MIGLQRIEIEGKRFVVIEESKYQRLCRDAGLGDDDGELPKFPLPDKNGRLPALEYTRVSIARDLIRQRRSIGLSQTQLANLAGVRQETISRLETGKHLASSATIRKIESAVALHAARRSRKARRQESARGRRLGSSGKAERA